MSAPRQLYTLAELSRERLARLLARAEALRSSRRLELLRGQTVIQLYFAPSLRTRVSMELAARQLGAEVVTLVEGSGTWKLETRDGVRMDGEAAEHLKEAVGVLGRYGDLLAVRVFPQRRSWEEDSRDPVFAALLRHAPVPVLNLESVLYHPCQALADLLAILRAAGGRADEGAASGPLGGLAPGRIVLCWADHPRALPVAVPNSFALAIAQAGWELVIARPEGYDLPPAVMEQCRALAALAGGTVEVTADREAALEGARFVYAKSWGRLDRYGREAEEIEERRARGLGRWIVDADAMARTDQAWFMHCLPVRRGVVVSDEVLDGPRSLVLEQAENRLHVQKAVLLELLGIGG